MVAPRVVNYFNDMKAAVTEAKTPLDALDAQIYYLKRLNKEVSSDNTTPLQVQVDLMLNIATNLKWFMQSDGNNPDASRVERNKVLTENLAIIASIDLTKGKLTQEQLNTFVGALDNIKAYHATHLQLLPRIGDAVDQSREALNDYIEEQDLDLEMPVKKGQGFKGAYQGVVNLKEETEPKPTPGLNK